VLVQSLSRHLLIASPALQDPNFHRTVVLIAHHDDEGAMGVVLNRPTTATVGEAVPEVEEIVGADETVYAGGPVATEGIVVLAELTDPSVAALRVDDDLGFIALEADNGAVAAATRRARAFAGHAGWGPGQLEAEIEEEAWIVEPARHEDAFCDDPDELWSTVLRRKGGSYALVARMPLDPGMN
jgi:putative transcriptional regulator